eukprot:19720-Chlamydomonas_euryale.AAC.2
MHSFYPTHVWARQRTWKQWVLHAAVPQQHHAQHVHTSGPKRVHTAGSQPEANVHQRLTRTGKWRWSA